MFRFKDALCLSAVLVGATPAHAALVETVTIENGYGGAHFAGSPQLQSGGTSRSDVGPGTWLGQDGSVVNRAEYGINYIGEVNNQSGSFYFLHNNYCVGTCGTVSQTVINFTIRNDGRTDEALRFDSLITPGHLARFGFSDASEAGFRFTVTQDPDTIGRQLYEATGYVSPGTMNVETPNGAGLNGLRQIEGDGWTVVDWGATNLNLNLGTLAAGQSTVVRYEASYYSRTSNVCLDLTDCSGVQVVFGDPRSNGGGVNLRTFAALASEPVRDVIDPLYKGYATSFAIVAADAPLPGQPDAMPELRYGNTFTPAGKTPVSPVPESATWAMMLLGFGIIGTALRNRRIVPRMAC